MAKTPVFVDPPDLEDEDILASLTAPVRRPTAEQARQQASTQADSNHDAGSDATSRESDSRRDGGEAFAARARASRPAPEPGTEPHDRAAKLQGASSRARPANADGARRAPNVSLYLSPNQKRELMRLKADLGLDYTEIVVDALKARHPQRRWGI